MSMSKYETVQMYSVTQFCSLVMEKKCTYKPDFKYIRKLVFELLINQWSYAIPMINSCIYIFWSETKTWQLEIWISKQLQIGNWNLEKKVICYIWDWIGLDPPNTDQLLLFFIYTFPLPRFHFPLVSYFCVILGDKNKVQRFHIFII